MYYQQYAVLVWYVVVMSPSRAGLSHSSSWRIFNSARLLAFFLENFTSARKAKNLDFLPLILFFPYFLAFSEDLALYFQFSS